mmetsp:Transcript_8547/g.35011  ORF Transcript_8547/g.35011 Transcript_8547/m.35011 type:complete len:206 (+) Transcript_8547:64-681(+)
MTPRFVRGDKPPAPCSAVPRPSVRALEPPPESDPHRPYVEYALNRLASNAASGLAFVSSVMYPLGVEFLSIDALPPQLSDLRVLTPVTLFTPLAYLHSACCCFTSISASEKSAPSMTASPKSLDVSTTRVMTASLKLALFKTALSMRASLRLAPSKSAAKATAFMRYAPVRFAPLSLALRISAPVKLDSLRSSPYLATTSSPVRS